MKGMRKRMIIDSCDVCTYPVEGVICVYIGKESSEIRVCEHHATQILRGYNDPLWSPVYPVRHGKLVACDCCGKVCHLVVRGKLVEGENESCSVRWRSRVYDLCRGCAQQIRDAVDASGTSEPGVTS